MAIEPKNNPINLSAQEPADVFSLAGTECIQACSAVSGREYRIMLDSPQSPPPPAGYPVIYLLDADMCFGTAVEAVRWQTKPPKGYDPAVVVGIGYPQHLDRVRERFQDYTTPPDMDKLPDRRKHGPWPPLGGAEAFLDFIEYELMPAVEARFPVDRARQAFIGHSLGGFLVLHAMFTRKPLFRTYVAGSPSIWWNGNALLEEEEAFRRKLEEAALQEAADGSAKTVGNPGSLENRDKQVMPEPERVLLIAAGGYEGGDDSRMLENAMEMGRRLSAVELEGLSVIATEFEGEGHSSMIPALLAKGIRLALAKNGQERAWNV